MDSSQPRWDKTLRGYSDAPPSVVGRLVDRAVGSKGKFEVGDREVLTEAAAEPLDSEAGLDTREPA